MEKQRIFRPTLPKKGFVTYREKPSKMIEDTKMPPPISFITDTGDFRYWALLDGDPAPVTNSNK